MTTLDHADSGSGRQRPAALPWGPLVAAALAAIAALLILVGSPARAPAGLLLVLVLPGYAIVAAAAPTRWSTGVERVLLSVGLSLVLAVLAGLVLNLVPGHMGAGAWTAVLATVTVTGAAVAVARRTKSRESQREWQIRGPGLSRTVGALLLALALAGTALGLSIASSESQNGVGRTLALWTVVRPSGTDFLVHAVVQAGGGQARNLILVTSEGGQPLGSTHIPPLAPNTSWTVTAVVRPGTGEPFVASLFRAGHRTWFRQVIVWLPTRAGVQPAAIPRTRSPRLLPAAGPHHRGARCGPRFVGRNQC